MTWHIFLAQTVSPSHDLEEPVVRRLRRKVASNDHRRLASDNVRGAIVIQCRRIVVLAAGYLMAMGMTGAQPGSEPKANKNSPAEWVAILKKGKNDSEHEAARKALGPEGPFGRDAIAALIDGLPAPENMQPNRDILIVLAAHGTAATQQLIDALKRSDANIRAGAARALGHVRPRPVAAAPALAKAMQDTEPMVRSAAAYSLGQMRSAVDTAVPALVAGLADSDVAVRYESIQGLGNLVRKPGSAVTALARTVAYDYGLSLEAGFALGQIGPAARDAVPILTEALRYGWIWSPVTVLGRIGRLVGPSRPSVGAAAMELALALDKWDGRDENLSPSRSARIALALAWIGPEARDSVPVLIQALQEPDQTLRRAAAKALGSIGPDAAPAVPALLAAVRWTDNPARGHAIEALGKIGPAAKDVVPILIKQLDSNNAVDQLGAAEALGGIGPAANASVPALIKIARDRSASSLTREYAAQAVGRIDPALAAKEQLEYAHLDIRQGKVPSVTLKPRPVTAEQAKRARALIAKLAQIERPDFGLSGSLSGQAFAPLPGRSRMSVGVLTDHKLATSDDFRELVEMGPAALPALLESLGDRTPTRLRIRDQFGGFFGFGEYLPTNPFNQAEKKALAIKPNENDEGPDELLGEYTVTVGDVCFVAIGQIVGRRYQAVKYIPSGIVSFNSPTASNLLRDQVRAAWAGADPAKVLLDSLLIDYSVEGIFNGSSLDGWDEGSDYQIEAAVRLLYYFPDETAPLIAARLRDLDVGARDTKGDGWMLQDVKNRVRTVEFVKAVSWCKATAIRNALAEIEKKTDDPAIKKAAGGK
jgi:HEAT repeat protein